MRNIVGVYGSNQQHWVGDGFPVRSLFSHASVAGGGASPFLLLDYAGPYDFEANAGRPRGVGSHPHKGFETVTIVYDGEVEHRDSTGAGGMIGPGSVQWMTAGDGVLHQEFHSEAFSRKGGRFEMVQLWVNLPAKDKSAPAGYQNITPDIVPVVDFEGGSARIIAGDFNGTAGPAKTFTPINMWDMTLQARGKVTLPVPTTHNVIVVLLKGDVRIGNAQVNSTKAVVLAPGDGAVTLTALADSKILLLSGEPINEPVVQYGPFVMNTTAEIHDAIDAFNSGKFGQIQA